jgi:hypothetical protein
MVFNISSPLASKSNHRHSLNNKGSSAAWRRFKGFEDSLRIDALNALPKTWPDLLKDSPLASRPKVAVVIYASSLIDAANLPKSITDALEGVCFANDASAVAVSCVVERSSTSKAAVAIAAFDPKTPTSVLTDSLRDLHVMAFELFSNNV